MLRAGGFDIPNGCYVAAFGKKRDLRGGILSCRVHLGHFNHLIGTRGILSHNVLHGGGNIDGGHLLLYDLIFLPAL